MTDKEPDEEEARGGTVKIRPRPPDRVQVCRRASAKRMGGLVGSKGVVSLVCFGSVNLDGSM